MAEEKKDTRKSKISNRIFFVKEVHYIICENVLLFASLLLILRNSVILK
ncbi:hypothetical protein ACFL6I_13360 [candidate division KSB1 bacterium]